MTYLVVSDLHCHRWSLFSKVDADGVNSRLRMILNELERAARELVIAGGNVMVIAGDIFHVRGSVSPEVLNPVQESMRRILDMGIYIYAIPGNHDLSGEETDALGSSIQTLGETNSHLANIFVANRPVLRENLAFVPWISDKKTLLDTIEELAKQAELHHNYKPNEMDLFIHAGLDDVLPNMPSQGLTAKKLSSFGFKRVFAGHYHNHKDLGLGVYSIGASTHQTWSDVGSRAGYLMVEADKVTFCDTKAPKFIDVSGMSEEDMGLVIPGNYVRLRGSAMTIPEIKELREFFGLNGALGISIQVAKAVVSARGSAPTAGVTIIDSISAYIDSATDFASGIDRDRVKVDCADVIAKVGQVLEEA
ncbi:MAG: metallophosphoesterase [Undibacterium sp.]